MVVSRWATEVCDIAFGCVSHSDTVTMTIYVNANANDFIYAKHAKHAKRWKNLPMGISVARSLRASFSSRLHAPSTCVDR